MNIKVIGHNEELAVRQVLMFFFSNLDDIFVLSKLFINGNEVEVYTKIKISDKIYEEKYKEKILDEKKIKNIVKKSTYLCAKKISDAPTPWGIMTGVTPSKLALSYFQKGFNKNEVIKIFKEDFLLEDSKIDLILKVYEKDKEAIKNMYLDGVSLYIGIPFCPSKCIYCSFLSSSSFQDGIFTRYINALIKEIKAATKKLNKIGKKIETIYIGGGTPTVASSDDFKRIFNAIYENIDPKFIKEITVEAGRPDTINKEKLKTLKDFGTTRIGINPQSMNNDTLKRIGRLHTSEDIVKAFYIAKEVGIFNINSDIIAGLSLEDEKDFRNTLDEVIKLNPQSISVHTMYIKRASQLKDEVLDISSNYHIKVTNMINHAYKSLYDEKYNPYYMYRQKRTVGNLENIGFSKDGYECLYNMYMMEDLQTIIGLGAGSSTKVINKNGQIRVYNLKEVREYINRIDEMIERKRAVLEDSKDGAE